ncbi:proteasome subunit beta type-6 [Galendromus occidentalis]|uniref:proteasome endopeptidase complex n=1 Tax=Galendromus occidentalis TaxID=34638 RepID=A0AAJ7WHU2_9ACAR|nr:proteasome subunit beta type-6 [Galendromus occidentalis]
MIADVDEPISTGTTLVAAHFKDGIVIAADSRTSSGSYVANRVADKLTKITDSIYCCRSGSAADTQCIADAVAYHLAFYEMQTGKPATVEAAANVFRNICYKYRDDMVAGIICAGYDDERGGGIYSIPPGGCLVEEKRVISAGSGSVFISGFLDALFKNNMSKEECVDLCLKAVSLAIHKDTSSGGVCRMAVITKDGVERKLFLNNELVQYEG